MSPEHSKLLLSVDLAGTFLFAVEGALIAVPANLDFLGVMVLAFSTALVGGIIRDVLIGASPPASLRDWRYATTAFAGGVIVFFLHPYIRAIPGPVIAVLLGAVTAVGGGTVRDVLLAQVPNVLRSDIYATAALAGAVVMVAATKLRVNPTLAAISGGLVCFSLRVISVWQHWNLPKAFTG